MLTELAGLMGLQHPGGDLKATFFLTSECDSGFFRSQAGGNA